MTADGHKRPLVASLERATTDPDQVGRWWTKWPNALIGGLVPAGQVVVDIDGWPEWDKLTAVHRDTPGTRCHGTPKGGQHRLFTTTETDLVQRDLGPKVNTRVGGKLAYVILPPSVRSDGAPYMVLDGRDPVPLPEWIAAKLRPTPAKLRSPVPVAVTVSLPTAYGKAALAAEVATLAATPEPGRNNQLNVAAFSLGQLVAGGELTEGEVVDALTGAAERSGREQGETAKTIASGLKAGAKVPRSAPAPGPAATRARVAPEWTGDGGSDGGELRYPDGHDGAVAHFIDWAEFWSKDRTEREWVQAPIIPRGRAVVIYAPAGEGKSELTLACVVAAATGQAFLDQPTGDPIHVLYLDAEMTEDDLHERLTELGYGPETDLSHLHYALLPDLPPLDTAEGGRALLALVNEVTAELVVIDTTGRVLEGAENDADSIRNYHRHTGRPLKAAGITVVRLDHAGKDLTKGQRGTSAKGDDVDVVWLLTRREGGARLKATKRRIGWVPEVVDLARGVGVDGVLRYGLADRTDPAGTAELVATLDRLGIPVEASRRTAEKALREAGSGARTELVAAALRVRRNRAITLGTTSGTTSSFQPGNHPGNHPPRNPPVVRRNHYGNHREPPPGGIGNQWVSL